MSLKFSIIATEGPHDQAVIARLLQLKGLKRFDGVLKSLDDFWKGFIPIYPSNRGNLYERMNMPSILTSQTHSVAIYSGGGSNLVQNITAIATNNKRYVQDIDAFGLVIDADTKQPTKVSKQKADELRTLLPMISEVPGEITSGKPRTGIFVLPDNTVQGTLDSNLVKCASVVYPDHKAGAEQFLDGLPPQHTQMLTRPFVKEKALVACIVSVLQPGMANTPSIAQDSWICEQTLNEVSEIASLSHFIEKLLEIG